MSKIKSTLTAERAREFIHYDPETGVCTWRKSPCSRRPVGKPLSSMRSGYLLAHMDGVSYKLHRVIWLIVTGEWPKNYIDHIDGDRTNNRLANLRDVPQSTNMQNLNKPPATNSSGFLGVSKWGEKYRAQIRFCGRRIHVGYFDTSEQAGAAYLEAKAHLTADN